MLVPRTDRHIRLIYVVTSCLLLNACGGKEQKPSGSPAQGDSGVRTADSMSMASAEAPQSLDHLTFAARPGAKDPPPKLKKHPKDDAAAWKSYRDALKMLANTDTHERQCETLNEDDESDRCLLELAPVKDARWIDWKQLDDLGVIIGRLENKGNLKEALFGIDKGQVVFWRVYARDFPLPGGGTMRRMVAQFIDSGTGLPVQRPSHARWATLDPAFATDEFPFRQCHQNGTNYGQNTVAQFITCAQSRRLHAPGKALNPSEIRSRHNNPAWITCADGCCSSEGP
jgi:hypothetical protein